MEVISADDKQTRLNSDFVDFFGRCLMQSVAWKGFIESRKCWACTSRRGHHYAAFCSDSPSVVVALEPGGVAVSFCLVLISSAVWWVFVLLRGASVFFSMKRQNLACDISIDPLVSAGEPAVARENNCLNAAKDCNLNDMCKKYRSSYISTCTSRVSTTEVCNKRKCHKALRQFFDKARRLWSQNMWKRRFSEEIGIK